MMSDLISRRAAIDALMKRDKELRNINWYDKPFAEGECKGIDYALEIVNALPSAQPEPQWILCNDRLPEEYEWIGTKKFGTTISDEVYVTFETPDGQRFTKHIRFQNGKLSSSDKRLMEVWYKDAKPIAWMPLPEPYQAERMKGEG